MATTHAPTDDAHAHDDHHDHPPFLAHHFDTPEQQFDSGKLGMWLFLVTEVLFFSGLFCAYAVYRFLRPEVFTGSSEFLNTQLGAINTGVLLFSSLTMAWAVRCSQTGEHKLLTGMLGATIGCATIFLGVKAIEYSHKFEMGLLPGLNFTYDPAHPHHAEGISKYLVWMSIPFAIALLAMLAWYVVSLIGRNKVHQRIAGPLTVAALCYFVGVGLGTILESGASESDHGSAAHASSDAAHGADVGHASAADDAHVDGHAVEGADAHAEPAAEVAVAEQPEPTVAEAHEAVAPEPADPVVSRLAQDATNSGVRQQLDAERRQQQLAESAPSAEHGPTTIDRPEINIFNPAYAGVFFGIYYCMTGIHAIHILAGIGALSWLLVRAARQDFNRQYFGPVDYVGLYWHIVDLIWIYLFPLLYLIR